MKAFQANLRSKSFEAYGDLFDLSMSQWYLLDIKESSPTKIACSQVSKIHRIFFLFSLLKSHDLIVACVVVISPLPDSSSSVSFCSQTQRDKKKGKATNSTRVCTPEGALRKYTEIEVHEKRQLNFIIYILRTFFGRVDLKKNHLVRCFIELWTSLSLLHEIPLLHELQHLERARFFHHKLDNKSHKSHRGRSFVAAACCLSIGQSAKLSLPLPPSVHTWPRSVQERAAIKCLGKR